MKRDRWMIFAAVNVGMVCLARPYISNNIVPRVGLIPTAMAILIAGGVAALLLGCRKQDRAAVAIGLVVCAIVGVGAWHLLAKAMQR